MFVSNLCVRTRRILSQINWEEVGLIVFHGLLTFAVGIYVAGETLGNWVHRTNDFLSHHWVRMLGLSPIPVMEEEENEEADEVPLPTVPSTPTELEQAPTPVITEEVSPLTTPAVEVELKLPPVSTEVVEIPEPQEQPQPVRRRRRGSAPRSQGNTVTKEVDPATNRRTRGPKAHNKRVRRTLAA